jgi:hypothetical protein
MLQRSEIFDQNNSMKRFSMKNFVPIVILKDIESYPIMLNMDAHGNPVRENFLNDVGT